MFTVEMHKKTVFCPCRPHIIIVMFPDPINILLMPILYIVKKKKKRFFLSLFVFLKKDNEIHFTKEEKNHNKTTKTI